MRKYQSFVLAIIFVFSLTIISSAQNYKIKQKVSMNGQKSDSTVYVKGVRKRTEGVGFMGVGGDVATVEQCDLKRYLKISDKKKMYAIEPFDDASDTPTTPTKPTPKPKNAPTVKGGVVTYVNTINDTGERKQMFGMTARRIKTSMSMEASPNACMKESMSIETDGWYIDLPEFSCPMTSNSQITQMTRESGRGGCQDKILFKTSGGGKLGFALQETRTMSSNGMSFTQTTETIEFTKATLPDSLFDIPQGYSLTDNSQDLYGRPDFTAMANIGNAEYGKPTISPTMNNPTSTIPSTKKSGMIRIGVFAPTNKSSENVSETNLRMFLVQKLTSGNVEAVEISSEADARTANCDYILTSEFSKIKQSTASKIGGIFGKVTGGDQNALKNYDVQVDFKLVSVKDGQVKVQNKANYKGSENLDRVAENALNQEVQMVLSSIK